MIDLASFLLGALSVIGGAFVAMGLGRASAKIEARARHDRRGTKPRAWQWWRIGPGGGA